MIHLANLFAGNDNPTFKASTHATEKMAETVFDTANTFADNVLRFAQDLSKCRNPQQAFAAVYDLAQENTTTVIAATQRSCTTFLEIFSELGNQFASALGSTTEAFDPAAAMAGSSATSSTRSRRRDKE